MRHCSPHFNTELVEWMKARWRVAASYVYLRAQRGEADLVDSDPQWMTSRRADFHTNLILYETRLEAHFARKGAILQPDARTALN